MATTLVFATERGLYPELVTAANKLGDDAVAAVLGPLADEAEGIAPGASKVLTASGGLDELHSADVTNALADIVDQTGATQILVGGNRRGKEIGPRLAARLSSAYIVTTQEIPEDGLFKRKFLGGKTMATEKPTTETVVATIAPHAFEPASGDSPAPEDAGLTVEKGRVERVELKALEEGGVNIEEADVVVAFGRGVKEEDDMELIFDLAEALGGEVGCSRPISADLHWLGDERWIGLSGKVVSPKLYVAVGISGQIQHLAGCRDSERIVVINTDKNAPFFEHADYGIVGDLYDVVPKLTELAGGS